jgi:hypothetical protein
MPNDAPKIANACDHGSSVAWRRWARLPTLSIGLARWLLILVSVSHYACRSNDAQRHDVASSANESDPRVLWVMARHGLAVGKIDDDAHEDVIGLCSDGLQGDASLCAFSGADLDLVWRTETFRRDLAHTVHVVAAAGRAVLIDPSAVAHSVLLASGQVTSRVQLADRAEEACVPREHPATVWLRLADSSEALLDPARGSLTRAPRPGSCRRTDAAQVAICMMPGNANFESECTATPLPPGVGGMLPMTVAYDGTTGALLGTHTPGTGYTMLAAFDITQEGAKVRFKRALADGSPLAVPEGASIAPLIVAGGRIVTQRADGVAAFDAASGRTVWSANPGAFMTLHASENRVYVGRWTALDIYAADTGRPIGTIGKR